MNLDKVSTFTIATGPRGSGKTLWQTAVGCDRLVKSFCAETWPNEVPPWLGGGVYSNYPLGFRFNFGNGHSVYLEAQPLNIEALMVFEDELRHSWVFIDEIDLWADRQDWASVTSKLLAKIFQQIRKKKMSLMATIQDLDWLNKRLQFQADIITNCREAAFTSWGQANCVNLGEVIFLNSISKSGIGKGSTFKESGRVYQTIFFGKRYWNCYDTEKEFDVLASSVKYEIKRPKRVIDLTGDGGGEAHSKDFDLNLLSDYIEELKASGCTEMQKPDFRRRVMERGIKSSTIYSIEKNLCQLGVGISGKEFSFEEYAKK